MKKTDLAEELFKTEYNPAVLYVYSLCKDYSLAEDVVCDCFYKALATYEGEIKSFKFWLLKVCKNAFLDRLKKRKKTVALHDNVTYDDDVLGKVVLDEEYRALYNAICLLEESYREIVILFYFEGLSINHIADLTQKSQTTVKVSLFRARNKLKEILEVK